MTKEILVNGVSYEIIDKIELLSENNGSQTIITNETREKTIFTVIPTWINGQFFWFKKIKVLQIAHLERYLEFDDGWSYQNYWGKYHLIWVNIKVIK